MKTFSCKSRRLELRLSSDALVAQKNAGQHDNYYDGLGAGLLPSVAQPPFPLHEFFPLQSLSAVLQPPLPLQEFWPLQACLSCADLVPICCSETPGLAEALAACACTANEPLIKPATAAPAIIVLDVMVFFLF